MTRGVVSATAGVFGAFLLAAALAWTAPKPGPTAVADARRTTELRVARRDERASAPNAAPATVDPRPFPPTTNAPPSPSPPRRDVFAERAPAPAATLLARRAPVLPPFEPNLAPPILRDVAARGTSPPQAPQAPGARETTSTPPSSPQKPKPSPAPKTPPPSTGTRSGRDAAPGDGDARGRRTPNPVYPEAARAAGEEGVVVVRMRVGADGRVLDAEVVSGASSTRLRRAALDAVASWLFDPKIVGGRPVVSDVVRRFVFRLEDR
jgi:periplasmic protein TonB